MKEHDTHFIPLSIGWNNNTLNTPFIERKPPPEETTASEFTLIDLGDNGPRRRSENPLPNPHDHEDALQVRLQLTRFASIYH
jgi:hypothetical protein